MSTIHFIDTSVLVELLNVPGKNETYEETKLEYELLVENGDMFVLPIAVLIETGNHIAHIADGNTRHRIAKLFTDIIKKAVDMEDNWSVIPEISTAILESIIRDFPAQALAQTGFGDTSIVKQFDDYWINRQPIGEMRIWSKDHHLQSYSRTGGLSRRRNK